MTDTALVALDRSTCPDCGDITSTELLDQDTLFIACGYGATLRTIVRYCRRCGWTLDTHRGDTRPPR